jgi:hypothetical protein
MILQSLLTLGLIGTLPLLIALWRQIAVFFKDPAAFRDLLLIFVVLTGIAESGAIGPTPSVLTLIWFISIFPNKQGSV